MNTRSLALGAGLAAVAVTAGVVVPGSGHAQAPPATTTLTFQETAPRVVMTDVPPTSKHHESVSLGDRLTVTGPLFDASHKRLGTVSGDCVGAGATAPVPVAQLLCTVAYDTPAGQIVGQGRFKLDGSQRLPIVGGSGAYAGVRGTDDSSAKPAKGFEDVDVLTLTAP